MKIAKKILKIFALIIIFVLLFSIIYILIHPISMPNKLVEKYIFLKIPNGTSIEKANTIIRNNDWEIKDFCDEHGIYFGQTGQPIMYIDENYSESLKKGLKMVGNKFIFAELGEYNILLNTVVFAYFIFDENDTLIQIAIRRDVEGI
ncbi:MAG: hypothetical protein LBM93_00635 [Oscillospiraceae bacterium]|jgi:hypothetical protein|nr:hypothetical protein [Oscillospiraceae bacterium]